MSKELHPAQIAALRKMTPARRLEIGLGFIEEMRALRAAMLCKERPDWSSEELNAALREFVLHARS